VCILAPRFEQIANPYELRAKLLCVAHEQRGGTTVREELHRERHTADLYRAGS
jgi:hypothetical protein